MARSSTTAPKSEDPTTTRGACQFRLRESQWAILERLAREWGLSPNMAAQKIVSEFLEENA